MGFASGFFTAFMLIGLGIVICELISRMGTRADEDKAIKNFCRENDYCLFGCGKGHNYGDYQCGSDHK